MVCPSLLCKALPLISLIISASCGVRTVPPEPGFSQPNEVLDWESEFRLDHSDSLFQLVPTVTVTSRGEFIVADLVELWIRRYDTAGGLRGDIVIDSSRRRFLDPLAFALELSADSIGAFSKRGTFTVFDPAGNATRNGNTGLARLYDGSLVNDTTLLLAGLLPRASSGPLIHLWDSRRESHRPQLLRCSTA
jgi:hypothetical protein